MNHPMSNHQIGQATHREYEAKYGSRFAEGGHQDRPARRISSQKWVLGVSGVAVSFLLALSLLF